MNTINFKGKEYPKRTFVVTSSEFAGKVAYTISTESLYEALGEAKEKWGSKENDIDNEVYFYVEDEVIGMNAKEICANHLDIEMRLIKEIW